MTQLRDRVTTAVLWLFTVVAGLGIAIAGASKFPTPNRWQPLFAGWGYPPWFALIVGTVEVAGAVAMFIPRFALYGAGMLIVVMAAALITLLLHPGGAMGWGATPAFYIALLSVIAVMRWRLRARS